MINILNNNINLVSLTLTEKTDPIDFVKWDLYLYFKEDKQLKHTFELDENDDLSLNTERYNQFELDFTTLDLPRGEYDYFVYAENTNGTYSTNYRVESGRLNIKND